MSISYICGYYLLLVTVFMVGMVIGGLHKEEKR